MTSTTTGTEKKRSLARKTMETLRMRRRHEGRREERTLRAIPRGGSECVL